MFCTAAETLGLLEPLNSRLVSSRDRPFPKRVGLRILCGQHPPLPKPRCMALRSTGKDARAAFAGRAPGACTIAAPEVLLLAVPVGWVQRGADVDVNVCLCVCACVCVGACVRACVRVCVCGGVGWRGGGRKWIVFVGCAACAKKWNRTPQKTPVAEIIRGHYTHTHLF